MEDTKQVIFRVGKEEYGLDIMLVNGIEKYINIVSVPNAPKCIKGIINLRGDVIPVYSLRRKFGLEEAEITDNTKLIVTRSKGVLMAYEVDEVEEILEISKSQLSAVPNIVYNEQTTYMGAVANFDGRLVMLLNHDGIITDQEKVHIQNMVID